MNDHIQALIKRAATAANAEEASMYSAAALNCARAAESMASIGKHLP